MNTAQRSATTINPYLAGLALGMRDNPSFVPCPFEVVSSDAQDWYRGFFKGSLLRGDSAGINASLVDDAKEIRLNY